MMYVMSKTDMTPRPVQSYRKWLDGLDKDASTRGLFAKRKRYERAVAAEEGKIQKIIDQRRTETRAEIEARLARVERERKEKKLLRWARRKSSRSP